MRVNEIGVIAMNLKEAVEKACQEPTLTEALTWIAVWETGRVVEQERTGISTASHGGSGDTLFKVCFEEESTHFAGAIRTYSSMVRAANS